MVILKCFLLLLAIVGMIFIFGFIIAASMINGECDRIEESEEYEESKKEVE